jgi:putative NADPH-quinone reductase
VSRRIALIQGHPDADPARFCRALATAYAAGAAEAGQAVREIDVAQLAFAPLRTRQDWEGQPPPRDIAAAQETVHWAEHLVILYPLWLGGMPALLKAFLEQLARPGFAFGRRDGKAVFSGALQGRSARIVVTMGMPALVYRWWFGAHSLKSLERNILGFVGIGPIRETLVGSVEAIDAARRARWLATLRGLGAGGR